MNAPDLVKHASLREALNAAARDVNGLVEKAGRNSEFKYAYVGHEHVLDHTREVLLRHGVAVIPTHLRFVQSIPFKGDRVLFLWEQTFEVSHTDSSDSLTPSLNITTLASESAAAKASTAADRVMLMRLCRLAGTSDQGESDRELEGRRQAERDRARAARASRAGADEHGEMKPDTREQEKATAEALAALGRVKLASENLLYFYRTALANLDRVRATREQRDRVWKAFDQHCAKGGIDAADLIAGARGDE